MLHQEEDVVALHQPLLLCLQQQSHRVVFVGQNHNNYTKRGFSYSLFMLTQPSFINKSAFLTSGNCCYVFHFLRDELRVAGVEFHRGHHVEVRFQLILHSLPQIVHFVPRVSLQSPANHGDVGPAEKLQGLHEDLRASFKRRDDFDVGVVGVSAVHLGGLPHKPKHGDVPGGRDEPCHLWGSLNNIEIFRTYQCFPQNLISTRTGQEMIKMSNSQRKIWDKFIFFKLL